MTVQTTPLFWDCECKLNYIHHHTIAHCPRCDFCRNEMPDSRIKEVAHHNKRILENIERQYRNAKNDLEKVTIQAINRASGEVTG